MIHRIQQYNGWGSSSSAAMVDEFLRQWEDEWLGLKSTTATATYSSSCTTLAVNVFVGLRKFVRSMKTGRRGKHVPGI